MSPNRPVAQAFSLVELVMVIALIMLLLALMLPTYTKVRDGARRNMCGYNMREIAASVGSFANDFDGHSPIHQVNYTHDSPGLGVYAYYGKTWYNHLDHGRFRGLGILANETYLTPKALYCPSWTFNKIGVYVTSGGSGGGWFKEADLPAAQSWMQSTYAYRGSFDAPSFRPVQLHNDPPDVSISADHFSDPSRGVDFHHLNGYMTAFLDGHAGFVVDTDHFVRDYNGGSTYHAGASNYTLQEQIWRTFLIVK